MGIDEKRYFIIIILTEPFRRRRIVCPQSKPHRNNWKLYTNNISRIMFFPKLQIVDGNAHLVEEERPETLTSDRKVKLVLVTMFRGGSSFLGELFKNNPDVLYWFEPTNPLFMSAIQEYHLYGDSGTFHLEEDNITCRYVAVLKNNLFPTKRIFSNEDY